jgi:hypothetical protein
MFNIGLLGLSEGRRNWCRGEWEIPGGQGGHRFGCAQLVLVFASAPQNEVGDRNGYPWISPGRRPKGLTSYDPLYPKNMGVLSFLDVFRVLLVVINEPAESKVIYVWTCLARCSEASNMKEAWSLEGMGQRGLSDVEVLGCRTVFDFVKASQDEGERMSAPC